MQDIVRSINASNQESKSKLLEQSTGGTFDLDDDKYTINADWLNNKKFIKQLEKDNIDVGLLREELSRQIRRKRHYTWREKILQILKRKFLQIFLSVLILIDAGIVITEIVLEIHSMKSKNEYQLEQNLQYRKFITSKFKVFLNNSSMLQYQNSDHDHQDAAVLLNNLLGNLKNQSASEIKSWCYSTFLSNSTKIAPHTLLRARVARSADPGRSRPSPLVSQGHDPRASQAPHEPVSHHKAELLHSVGLYLHYISIAALIIFTIELMLRIVCTGKKFFHKKAEVFDGTIIVTSLLADIIFVQLESEEITVMVVFLLWRIIRLINGLMMHEKQRDEFRITLQKKTRRICQMKVDRLSTEKELLTKNVVALEDLNRELGATEEQIRNCKPRFKSVSKEQTNNALKSIAALTTGFMGGLVGAPSASGQGQNNLLSRLSGGTPTPTSPSPSSGGLLMTSGSNGTQSPGTSSTKKLRLRLRKISEAQPQDKNNTAGLQNVIVNKYSSLQTEASLEKDGLGLSVGGGSFENQSSSEAGEGALSSPQTCSSHVVSSVAVSNRQKVNRASLRLMRAQHTSENEDLPLDNKEPIIKREEENEILDLICTNLNSSELHGLPVTNDVIDHDDDREDDSEGDDTNNSRVCVITMGKLSSVNVSDISAQNRTYNKKSNINYTNKNPSNNAISYNNTPNTTNNTTNSSFGSKFGGSRGYSSLASRSTTATSEEEEFLILTGTDHNPTGEFARNLEHEDKFDDSREFDDTLGDQHQTPIKSKFLDDDERDDIVYPPNHQIFAARASLPILTHADRRRNFRENFRRRNSSNSGQPAAHFIPIELEDDEHDDDDEVQTTKSKKIQEHLSGTTVKLRLDSNSNEDKQPNPVSSSTVVVTDTNKMLNQVDLLTPTGHLHPVLQGESSVDSPPPSADEGIGSSSNSQMIPSSSATGPIFNTDTVHLPLSQQP